MQFLKLFRIVKIVACVKTKLKDVDVSVNAMDSLSMNRQTSITLNYLILGKVTSRFYIEIKSKCFIAKFNLQNKMATMNIKKLFIATKMVSCTHSLDLEGMQEPFISKYRKGKKNVSNLSNV